MDDVHQPLTMENWLSKIANAKILITNSFHGMVVALLSHIPFIVDIEKGSGYGMNDRFYTLLDRLGLIERIVGERFDINTLLQKTDMNWNIIDKRLDDFKEEGKAFLQTAFQ
jgi:exopolysaccharide biosynthesis predicted pyruvyltransferase EpsI